MSNSAKGDLGLRPDHAAFNLQKKEAPKPKPMIMDAEETKQALAGFASSITFDDGGKRKKKWKKV
jgi:hypothetical protein